MARRRKGRPVDGVLILDKPLGLSSNHALQNSRHLFFAAKAGHTGALDPLASGVLPICFGEATKFSQYLLDADKAYISRFVLGEATDSYDAEGEVVERKNASHLTQADVEQALQAFKGEIEQVPPMHSAIKRNGQPLYKLARKGVEVEREARCVTIYDIVLRDFQPGAVASVEVEVRCSKGTYIRSLAYDLGRALGVGGHVGSLRRSLSGPYAIEDAVSLEQLQALKAEEAYADMDALLLPIRSILSHLPAVALDEQSRFFFLRGNPVMAPGAPVTGQVYVEDEAGQFLGLAEMDDDGRIAPKRLIATD